MNTTDPQFKSMILRLQSGEITRNQAADAYGIRLGTLNMWISRKKLSSTIPATGLAGTALERAETDPDKVNARRQAAARVLAGEISALAVAREYPGLSHRTIAQDVRKARIKLGQPVQHRTRTPAQNTAPNPAQ